MTEAVYDTWGGLTFGDNGTDPVTYGLIETDDLDGAEFDGDALTGGFDGEAATAQWATGKQWVERLDLTAAPGADWEALLDDLRAATARPDVGEFVTHHRNTAYTRFASVVKRTIPRDANAVERGYGEAQIVFASSDPLAYGSTTATTLTDADPDAVVTSDGWVDSERWKWVVPGPVTNPQIASTVGGSAVVRYVGTIASGHHLVVELLPRGQVPGYYAKVVTTAELSTYQTVGVGNPAYGNLDGGAAGPDAPQWFPVAPGAQTLAFSCTSGTAGCTFTWRPGFH